MFEKLLEPGTIGRMQLKNHVLMSPTETHFTRADGCIAQEEIDYYVERAKGGAALITTHQVQGNTKLDPIDPYPRSARLDDDAFIPMMGELTEAVHLAGAKISVLLSPGGGAQALGYPYDAGSDGVYDVANVAPGTVGCPVSGKKVRMLTKEEIRTSVKVYGKSAERAKRAGFDAITIHAHCGYLIAEFLSPYFNNRTDEYGGSLENRARFLLELIAETRKNVGPGFPIIVRYAVDEMIGDAGRQLAESVELAKMMEEAGVDALDLGAGVFQSMSWICPTIYHNHTPLADYTKVVKDAVNIPVIIQGRLQNPEDAERMLEEGKADFVAMGRAWIAEPNWVNKIACGDAAGIRRCINCNHCIGDRISSVRTLRCTLNPVAGREFRYSDKMEEAKVKKHVVVIGAGPAGLETAYRAALKGHKVDLYEKTEVLCGGQIMAAKASPGKDILKNIPDFYQSQLERLDNVRIHMNTEVNDALLMYMPEDTVVVYAGGGHPFVPGIKGIKDCKNVVTGPDVLTGKAETEGRVLIAGGGQAGVETAYQLLTEGKEVSVIEMLPDLALNEEGMTKMTLMPILEKLGLRSYVSHQILEVLDHELIAKDLNTGKEVRIPFDTLVMALGTRPEQAPEIISNRFPEHYVVGDAEKPGNIRAAIEKGYFTALKI